MQMYQGSKYRWLIKEAPHQEVARLSAQLNLSLPVAHTLYNRGYCNEQSIQAFLFSSYEKDVADSRLLKGASIALERLLKAIKNKEKILIFGDYDVDGITSTSMLLVALLPLDANINFYLPNRVRDGYGLSSKVVQQAVTNNYQLIITVDNGISAHEAAETAQRLGIDLIITDHHRPHALLPPALCIVNPNQLDCPYPHKELAGVGVTFKLISLLYQELNMPLPDKIYELLMLGTIADVVPLITENRFWVRHGLLKTNQNLSYAMRILAANSGLEQLSFNSRDIGFMIAPQLNALGRLDDPRDAVKFLISAHQDDVLRVGTVLKTMNDERKRIDKAIYRDVERAIEQQYINLQQESLIMAAHQDWPAGVIGLVAGRLMHNYGRPCILFHLTPSGLAKGSCRSIPAFNIFDALQENQDLLISFGGHSMAAGLALDQKKVPLLKERLEEKITALLTPDQLQPTLQIDAPLHLADINKRLTEDLARMEPFGNHNPEPTFLIQGVRLQQQPRLLKDAHVKCSIFLQGVLKPVIFFNRPDLYTLLSAKNEEPFDIVGTVITNQHQGRTNIELRGLDVAYK